MWMGRVVVAYVVAGFLTGAVAFDDVKDSNCADPTRCAIFIGIISGVGWPAYWGGVVSLAAVRFVKTVRLHREDDR